jgi:hypothetical protein
MSSEIIVIFLGRPVTSSEIIVSLSVFLFLSINEVIVTFLSNDVHLCLSAMLISIQYSLLMLLCF